MNRVMNRGALLLGLLELAACKAPAADTHTSEVADGGAGGLRIAPALLHANRVQIAPVVLRPLRGSVQVAAEVVADEAGEGDATTLIAGRVAKLTVADGDRVKAGDVLAWLDAPEATRAAADWLRARGRADQTARALGRQTELERENATSKSALDDARAADAAAQADWMAARTLLRSYGASEPAGGAVARVAVRAPIDGVIAQRFTAVGSPVTPDRPLFHLIAPERVYVSAKIPETMSGLAGEGGSATLIPREIAGAAPCPARIVRVIPVIERDRHSRVRLAPDASCKDLRSGRYVDVAFESGETSTPALVVAKEAVLEVKGAEVVFVQRGDGSFSARPVRLGASTQSEIAIEDGVHEGESVVTVGAVLLKGELLRAELGEE